MKASVSGSFEKYILSIYTVDLLLQKGFLNVLLKFRF